LLCEREIRSFGKKKKKKKKKKRDDTDVYK